MLVARGRRYVQQHENHYCTLDRERPRVKPGVTAEILSFIKYHFLAERRSKSAGIERGPGLDPGPFAILCVVMLHLWLPSNLYT